MVRYMILSTKNIVGTFAILVLMMICIAPLFIVATSDFEPIYYVGVSDTQDAETKITYELKVFDKELADEYLDTDDNTPTEMFGEDAEVGAKMAVRVVVVVGLKVDSLEFKRENASIQFKIWGWTTDDKDLEDEDNAILGLTNLWTAEEVDNQFGEDLTANDLEILFNRSTIFNINEKISNAKYDFNIYFIPKVNSEKALTTFNAANYLARLKLDEDEVEDKKISVSYTTISIKYEKDVVRQIEFYNALGIIRSYKLVTADGQTIVDVSAVEPAALPLDWTILLGMWVGIGTVLASGLWTLWRIKKRGGA